MFLSTALFPSLRLMAPKCEKDQIKWSSSEGRGRLHSPCLSWDKDYKYLGVHIHYRVKCMTSTKHENKNGMRRLYLLRKLISFNMGSNMMEIICQSVVVSLLYFFFAVVCWGSSIRAGKSNTLNKLTRKAGSVILELKEPK